MTLSAMNFQPALSLAAPVAVLFGVVVCGRVLLPRRIRVWVTWPAGAATALLAITALTFAGMTVAADLWRRNPQLMWALLACGASMLVTLVIAAPKGPRYGRGDDADDSGGGGSRPKSPTPIVPPSGGSGPLPPDWAWFDRTRDRWEQRPDSRGPAPRDPVIPAPRAPDAVPEPVEG